MVFMTNPEGSTTINDVFCLFDHSKIRPILRALKNKILEALPTFNFYNFLDSEIFFLLFLSPSQQQLFKKVHVKTLA